MVAMGGKIASQLNHAQAVMLGAFAPSANFA
jgi:hypothetical protein